MQKLIRNRLTFANVVSVIALFVALSGSAFAASIAANSVGTRQLRDQSVTTSKINDAAVTGDKIDVSTFNTVPSADVANTANGVSAGALHGAALAPIITVQKTTDPFAAGASSSAFIQCPAGTTLLSGGGEPNIPMVVETLSRKSGDNGWRYDAYNINSQKATITVFAYCLS